MFNAEHLELVEQQSYCLWAVIKASDSDDSHAAVPWDEHTRLTD